MAVKIKPWVWIVIGIFVFGILCVVAVAGLGFYFFSQHFETQEVSRESAVVEFDQVKARFTGQKPLIELDERGHFVKTNSDRPARPDTPKPKQIYVLAYDPDEGREGRIVKVTIPFWLLRLKGGHSVIDLDGGRMDLEDLKLTVEDLERFGPTLIVDHAMQNGERVLVWSQ
jgi:hypothetical protein